MKGKPSRTIIARPQLGFTLTEVVVAMAIVGFVVIPLVGSLMLAHRSNAEARTRTELALVAQSCNALLGSTPPSVLQERWDAGAPIEHFFAEGARWLGSTPPAESTSVYYRCTFLKGEGEGGRFLKSVVVEIEYPAPSYSNKFAYPQSAFHYGTTFFED